ARLEVNETRLSLAKHSVEVAKVILNGGDIKAWMSEAGRLNLLELAPGASASAPAAAPAAGAATAPAAAAPVAGRTDSSSAWTVSAPDIQVQGLKVSAEDRGVKPAVALLLNPLNIH